MSFNLRTVGIIAVAAASLVLGACTSGSDDGAGGSSTPESEVDSPTVTFPDLAWTRSTSADLSGEGAQRMFDVVAADSGLVAVGMESPRFSGEDFVLVVWTSPGGSEWTRVHTIAPTAEPADCGAYVWRAITAGGPGLVTVGLGGACASSDGLSWQGQVGAEDPDAGVTLDVTAGGPGLVAVGVREEPTASSAAVWTSPDGLAWTAVPDDEAVFADGYMSSVTQGGPGLVAVGQVGRPESTVAAVWTSPDGLAWTRVPHDDAVFGGEDGNASMSSVTTGGPGLVAVGSDAPDVQSTRGAGGAAVWTSPDGATWTRVPDDEAVFGGVEGRYMVMLSVAATESTVVAVGQSVGQPDGQPLAWSSTDEGATWSLMDLGPLFDTGETAALQIVTAGGPGLVVVGWVDTGDVGDAVVLTATPTTQ